MLDFEICTEMDVQQDEITFTTKSNVEKVKYDFVVRGKRLCFQLCAGYEVVGNKLQLQWTLETAVNSELATLTIKQKYVKK
jgi:fructose-1,6-bisphosphatase